MVPQRLVGALVVLSFACTASAQTTTSKPKPTKKPTVAAKPAPPPPEPAPPPAPPPASGVHLRTRYVTGAQVSENTTYLTSGRQRFEFPGITMINQCDMQRSVQLHDAARRFMVIPTGVSPAPSAPPAAAPEADTAAQVAAMSAAGGRGGASSKPKAGVITETITLTDTGERKQMFGLEARRIRTVVTRQPGPDACETKATRLETDGWYADLPELASCSSAPSRSTPASATPPQACIDHVVTQESGGARLGFALSTVVTTTIADASASEKDRERDKEVSTMSMEVVDLKVASLDKALFEVPADYTEVKDFKALLPSLANGGSLSDAVFGSVADGTSSVAPKKEGVIRVGVVTPANKSTKELPELRLVGSMLSGFTKQPFEALPVQGATLAELDRDAASKGCDYVLVSDIAELKTSKPNKVGGMLKKVSGDTNTVSEIHDVRIDYKLYTVGDPGKPKVSSSVKASSGGGFGVGSALKFAYFAGSMYMTMGMAGGMGGMMGMMGPGSSLGGLGGVSSGMMGARVNPGMGAAMSIMSAGSSMAMLTGAPGGMMSDGDDKIMATVQEALAKAGKQAGEDVKKDKAAAKK